MSREDHATQQCTAIVKRRVVVAESSAKRGFGRCRPARGDARTRCHGPGDSSTTRCGAARGRRRRVGTIGATAAHQSQYVVAVPRGSGMVGALREVASAGNVADAAYHSPLPPYGE